MGQRTNLGEHATPGDDVGIDRFSLLLFVALDGGQEAVEMLVDAVVMLDELVDALRQADGKP